MKPLFSPNPKTVNYTAFVNWRVQLQEGPHNLIVLGDGFFDSAIILIEHALRNNTNKIADSIIFPMIHNINHAIELHLKAIEYSLNCQLQNGRLFSGGHDVLQLLQTVLSRIEDIEGKRKSNEYGKIIVVLSNYINEIYHKVDKVTNDKKLEFSRYPVMSNKRDAHFYIKATENVEIDLENYLKIVHDMRNILKQMLDEFYFNK